MPADEAVEVDPVHLGGGRGLGHVAFVALEQSADVPALERLDEPPARFRVREADIDWAGQGNRFLGSGMEHLLERGTPLEVVPQLTRVPRPGRDAKLGKEPGIVQGTVRLRIELHPTEELLGDQGMSPGRSLSGGRVIRRTARRK